MPCRLGRDPHMQQAAKIAISLARQNDLYVVLDADGLWLVQNEPDVVKGYKRAVLTPNVVEFARLAESCVSVSLSRTLLPCPFGAMVTAPD